MVSHFWENMLAKWICPESNHSIYRPFASKQPAICVELMYNSSYYHHQIRSITNISLTRLIIIIKLVSTHTHTPGYCDFNYCAILWYSQSSSQLWSDGRLRLYAHYTISLSSLCTPIWRYWKCSNACQIYSVPNLFSQLSSIQYMGLCVFSLPISVMMIVRIPVLDLVIII